jgi:hypothetical protein
MYSGLNAAKRDTASDDNDDNGNSNSNSHQHQRDNNGGTMPHAFMSSLDEGLGFLWSSRRPWCDAVAETIHE